MERRVIYQYQLPTPQDSPLHNEPHLTTPNLVVSHSIAKNSPLSITIRIISSFLRILFINLPQFLEAPITDSVPSQQKLEFFISSVLKRSKLDLNDTLIFTSVYYLFKIFESNKFANAPLKSLCARRLWLLSLILSSKYHNEKNYSFKVWSNITGLSIMDLNFYEVLLLKTLNYDLFIDNTILVNFKEKLMSINDLISSVNETNLPISPPSSPPSSSFSQLSPSQFLSPQAFPSQHLPSPSLSLPLLSPDSSTSPNQKMFPCLIVNVPATKVNLLARLLTKEKQAQIDGYVENKNVHATNRKRCLDNDNGSGGMGNKNYKKFKP